MNLPSNALSCLLSLSLGVVMSAATSATLDAAAETSAVAARTRTERVVLAHYMVCFASPLEFYKREILLAQSHGIDGFALNCGDWLAKDGEKTQYVLAAERIFQAAKELGTGFRLVLSPDFACEGINKAPLVQVTDMLKRFYDHPNLWRIGGKAVLSGYAGSPDDYAAPAAALKKDGLDFLLIPKTSDQSRYAMAWSLETVIRDLAGAGHIDGLFNFACDGTVNDLVRNNAAGRRGTMMLGKFFLAGACPAYNSPNLRDFRGLSGYCAMWEGIIRDGADGVEIVTWNDYVEDSNLMPFRWQGPASHFDRDEAALDATRYYADWFKSGVKPAIPQDKVYLAYRTRSRDQTRVWDEEAGSWVDVRDCAWPYEQIHDDVADQVYVTSFLSRAAQVTVTIGGEAKRFAAPAGVSSQAVAMRPGVPAVRIERDGAEVLVVTGNKSIIGEATPDNSVKGERLAFRTWISGAVAGKGALLPMGEARAQHGATLAAGVLTIPDMPDAAAAFTLPTGFTGACALRITYSYPGTKSGANPGQADARLTMRIDGGPAAGLAVNERFADAVPWFLPPTGTATATVSKFITIFAGAKELSVSCVKLGKTGKNGAVSPGWDDLGGVTISAIEVVRIVPPGAGSAPTPWPDLVDIPAGSFTRAPRGEAPDEAPPRPLSMPAFAIGRYEVTNEEFERYSPAHRHWRDGFSWRDREPVIYVSWAEAARYCNWLSTARGLKPAYDETTWAIDQTANGFHLPTEAEWEYVASGRGENRRYPWGDAKPIPGVHGNFDLGGTLAIPTCLRSSSEEGVTVVGSFPAGDSRDGVADLAGNVAEWCTDTYALTTPENLTYDGPSHHRAIRGGSWGYYNHSQRVTDREFNNSGYPGYIYMGLRVALPATGVAALTTPAAGSAKP